MTKILVTGGAGAIGFHLCNLLAQNADNQVFLVDNYCRSKKDKAVSALISQPNVTEIVLDLCNTTEFHNLPTDVDYVYHLAAMNGTQNFYEKPFDVLLNCTLPTVNLLNHYKHSSQLKRFIYAGSSEAYAATITLFNWQVPTAEDVPLGIADPNNVRWSYGGSKLHGELATIAAGAQFNMPFTIVRYHNVYGPRMGDKHVIPDFLTRVKNGVYELYGFEDTRSFIYVTDAVNATITCAESDNTINEIVNVGSPEEIQIHDLGKIIMKLLNIDSEIVCHPSPAGSVARRAPDITKLQKLTKFESRISLEEGLKKTISDYLSSHTVSKDLA